MSTFFWNAKGYLAHYAVLAVAFLDPSVQAYFAHNKMYAMIGLMVWGSILHWASGKLTQPQGGLVMKAVIVFLALSFLAVGAQAQTKAVKAKTATVVGKTAVVATRKNSVLHVLSNIPKAFVGGVRIVTDTGEYVTGKIHDGFVKLDAAADEYVEGQTQ